MPTALERTGDFSEIAGSTTIYDPLTVDLTSGVRQPFAGNLIPSTRINPTSNFLLGLIPLPTNSGTLNNFTKAASTGGNVDEYVTRADVNISANSRLFGRFSYWKMLSLAQDPFGTGLCKDRCSENTRSKSAVIGFNHAFTPTTIADFNFSASRFHYLRLPINSAFVVTSARLWL